MSYSIEDAKALCLERDAHRCRHCGTTGDEVNDLIVEPLVPRAGRLTWHLSNLVTRCRDCFKTAVKVQHFGRDDRVGVILCGGRGTRLYPLTMYQNKHTLPIGLVPMIFYPVKTLQHFGIKRALVVTDREGTNASMKMLGSGKEFGMDFSYKIQEGAGGVSEALYLAKDFAKPGDEIVCILGDNIFDIGAIDNQVKLDENTKACVWLKHVDNPRAYGVAQVEDGRVTEIVEKPQEPKSDMAVVGLYMFDYDVFNTIDTTSPSERGELEISSVNDHYAKQGKLAYKMVNGYWGDAGGSIQRYAECNMHGAKEANVSAEEIDSFRSIVFDDK